MVSPISFTSTYKVSNKNNFQHEYLQFRNFAVDKECTNGVSIGCEDKVERSYPYRYSSATTMVVPDSMDKGVEAFCKSRGINFTKLSTKDLMKTQNIEKRIKPAPRGMQIAKVNVEKLEELIDNQNTNLNHCENVYDNYFASQVDYMLKSGNDIQASTLYIHPKDGIENTIDYIKRYGAKNLNNKQLFIDFHQSTDEPDHCTYFALRDLGMKNVPVYVNENTYKIGSALGLFE